MRPFAPKFLLTLLSAALVLWIFDWEQKRTLGPPLSMVHAQEAELQSSAGCTACHGELEGTAGMLKACVHCHEAIGQDLDAGVGLHGAQLESGVEDCTICHIEHAGRGFPLVSEASFRKAGFDSLLAYEHESLGREPYGLTGAHDELACERCHENGDVIFLERGDQRFRGLSQACDSCHEDPHEGAMVRECVECHGQVEKFERHAKYEHTLDFPLLAAHGEQECKGCHEPGSEYSIETLGGESPPVGRTCAACHEHQHSKPFLEQVASLATGLGLIEEGTVECLICHDPEDKSLHFATQVWEPELHAASGFALLEPHADIECGECHFKVEDPVDFEADWMKRFPGRDAADCEACHEDPHRGQFAKKIPVKNACLECHSESHFVPAGFGFESHAKTDFPLVHKHQAVACFACHEVPAGKSASARQWHGVSGACADCHDDAHDGAFDAPLELQVFEGRTGCGRCHTPTGFSEIIQEEFDHGLFTAFDLGAAHHKAECEACHAATQSVDAFARVFGRIEVNWGAKWEPKKACVLCHADPHDGAFDGADLPSTENGRQDCARCHTELDWNELHEEKFDHRFWTGYELPQGHDRAACEACHLPTATPDSMGRRFGRIEAIHGTSDPNCQACHADPHFAIFEGADKPQQVDGQVSCARCHNLNLFSELLVGPPERFDHDLWTASDMQSKHLDQSCDDCHPPIDKGVGLGRLLGGLARRGRVRAAAPGRTCAACHEDEHRGQFQGPATAACDVCHTSQSDFKDLDFDHQADSRFALDDNHRDVACDACHGRVDWPGGGQTVLYRPLGMLCADCHSAGGRPSVTRGGPR